MGGYSRHKNPIYCGNSSDTKIRRYGGKMSTEMQIKKEGLMNNMLSMKKNEKCKDTSIGFSLMFLCMALFLLGAMGILGGGCGGGGSGNGSDGGLDGRVDADVVGDGQVSEDGHFTVDGGEDQDGGTVEPPQNVCELPISLVDTSNPDHTVGTGTPESCDEAALKDAVEQGGIITFDCGEAPVVIEISETVMLPTDRDTIIDGEGMVTLDGLGQVRIMEFYHGNYRVNTNKILLQRLTFQNGRAQGEDYTEPDPDNPACAYGYADGAGGAVRVRDGVLHVVECTFLDNNAATPGPDVGGGAIYVLGSLDVTVVGTVFMANSGSNGGAVGLLQTTGTFVNSVFQENTATGTGQNYAGGDAQGCPGVGHPNQGGAGGNGGAISIDGADDLEQFFCGVVFKSNHANELGGCVFRTANGQQRPATFRQCAMVENGGDAGGGCLYISNSEFTLSRSLVSGNYTDGLGGGVRTELGSQVSIVNTTFHENITYSGLAAALSVGGTGEVRNCTFADNKVEGGEVVFTAAIRADSSLGVYNTIFSNNTTHAPWNPQTCWFDPFAGENNFQWPTKTHNDARDDWPCTEDITWADAELTELSDNGGPTHTMLPAQGSVVIGAGQDCPGVDQRGETRPQNDCTAGAVEVSSP